MTLSSKRAIAVVGRPPGEQPYRDRLERNTLQLSCQGGQNRASIMPGSLKNPADCQKERIRSARKTKCLLVPGGRVLNPQSYHSAFLVFLPPGRRRHPQSRDLLIALFALPAKKIIGVDNPFSGNRDGVAMHGHPFRRMLDARFKRKTWAVDFKKNCAIPRFRGSGSQCQSLGESPGLFKVRFSSSRTFSRRTVVGDVALMGGDELPEDYIAGRSFNVTLNIEQVAGAERIFAALSESGTVMQGGRVYTKLYRRDPPPVDRERA
jgi:hypothetical protein